jgi:hypothetical protein
MEPPGHAGGRVADDQEHAAVHHGHLQHIRPDDGFKAAFHRVDGRHHAHQGDAEIDVQAGRGRERERWEHHDDARPAEDFQQNRETGGDEPDAAAEAPVEVGKDGRGVEPADDADEAVGDNDADAGADRPDNHRAPVVGVGVGRQRHKAHAADGSGIPAHRDGPRR